MKKCYSACRNSLPNKDMLLQMSVLPPFWKKNFVRLIICIINTPNFILIVLLHYEKKNPKKRLFFEHSNRCNPLSNVNLKMLIWLYWLAHDILRVYLQSCHKSGKPGKGREKCKRVWNFELCSNSVFWKIKICQSNAKKIKFILKIYISFSVFVQFSVIIVFFQYLFIFVSL